MYTQLMKTLSNDFNVDGLMTLTVTFDLFLKTLTFAITFEPLKVELSYFMCTLPVIGPFQLCQKV